MEITALYDIAAQQNIEVIPFPLPENGSMSIMADSGECYIGIDPIIQDGTAQEMVHMAHELGHCITGSFYNRYAAIDHRLRHENKADKWAIQKLIPIESLDEAVAQGCTELWELADWFHVTEDFIKKAVCYYVHGNLASELYF